MVALACTSCRGASPDEQGALLEPYEARSIEDSGKRISGDFILKSLEDDYANKEMQDQPPITFRLEEGGAFKIVRESGGAVISVEEGTYMISTLNELVLYVEKVSDRLLDEARVNRYVITEQSGDRIKLRRSPSAALMLEKR